jgi:poly-gamma-glutamate capsule biosynthesis protein CapA/YwtB (metallophosphatase superfamily)
VRFGRTWAGVVAAAATVGTVGIVVAQTLMSNDGQRLESGPGSSAASAASADDGVSASATTPASPNGSTPAAAPTPTSTTSDATSTTTSTTAPPTTTSPPGTVTFAFTGDILTHRAVNRSALQPDGTYNYGPMFANIAPVIAGADVGICHLEPPVAPAGTDVIIPPPLLAVSDSIAPTLAGAGYDRCSTASNHSYDLGAAGVDATVAAFNQAGIGQSGMAASREATLPNPFSVNGVMIAHLSYTFSFNGIPTPNGETWRSNEIDPERIIADAGAVRSLGAQMVVVSMHWGQDKVVQPTAAQRQAAEAITASGLIDLVVGHHAHVLQPIEQVNGVWVVWGLGNIVSDHPTSFQWPASSQDAAIAMVTLRLDASAGRVEVGQPVIIPTWCDTEAGHIIRLTTESANEALPPTTREQLQISEQRTRDLLGDFVR